MIKRLVLVVVLLIVLASGAWAVLHFKNLKQLTASAVNEIPPVNNAAQLDWASAIEKVKGERADPMGAVETPPELRHYSDRHWFLATQVAEIKKNNVPVCQDFLDLAVMIQRGELVPVPGVTETYVLYGVAQRVDDSAFTSDDDQNAPRDYAPLQALAKDFAGRSYNLDDPADRQALKANMLSSLRPAALKILEEVAGAYQRQFDRPLPVSSLVRPEQYQHVVRRYNRNAVLIEAPPHSTGLAFDIDYRFMSAAEQNFVMAELARLKNEGRIEAIRERNANYHVFAFLNGTRPSDDLIAASVDDTVPPGQEVDHTTETPTVKETKRKPAKVSHKAKVRQKSKHRRKP